MVKERMTWKGGIFAFMPRSEETVFRQVSNRVSRKKDATSSCQVSADFRSSVRLSEAGPRLADRRRRRRRRQPWQPSFETNTGR